jgi:hypothetical protein
MDRIQDGKIHSKMHHLHHDTYGNKTDYKRVLYKYISMATESSFPI